MLNTTHNKISNKLDTTPTNRRPNSPTAETDTLEQKFGDILAKATKEAQNTKKIKDTKKTQEEIGKPKQNIKETAQSHINKSAQKMVAPNLITTPSVLDSTILDSKGKVQSNNAKLSSLDLKDDIIQKDSKIDIQEKITQSSKEPNLQTDPLIEALSASSNIKEDKNNTDLTQSITQEKNKTPVVNKNPLNQGNSSAKQADLATLVSTQQTPTPQNPEKSTTSSMSQTYKTDDTQHKTLNDVEQLAKTKGLNPTQLTLLKEGDDIITQSQNTSLKIKTIPLSAKEKIVYEYENNVDRIAIIKRGVNKPKNITSKISNEYPTKSLNAEGSKVSSLKDRP